MFSFLKPPDWETDGAAWPHREESRFVDAGGYCWHVQRMGAGPTLLLIHGTGASTHSWAGLAPLLATSCDVVAFDLPGHGFTNSKDWCPPSLSHVAAQVGLLLEDMDIAPAIVVGHSAGAAIMIRMAMDRAISPSLAVSINGALSPFAGAAGLMFPIMAKLLYYNPLTAYAFAQGARDIARVRRLIEQTGSSVSEENIQRYATLMRRPGHIAGALGMMAHWDLTAMNAGIAGMMSQSIFIAGQKDKAVPPKDAKRAAALTPHGQEIILHGLGHLAHEEAPERVAEIITAAAAEVDII